MNSPDDISKPAELAGLAADSGARRARLRRDRMRQAAERAMAARAPEPFFHPVPLSVWAVTVCVVLWGMLGPNRLIVAFAALLLPFMVSLLWIKGEPPVLFFCCFMQWLQASIAVIYTSMMGRPLNDSFGGAQLEGAIWLSLLGILVLAFGMRVALIGLWGRAVEKGSEEIRALEPTRVFIWYIFASIFSVGITFVSYHVPSIQQPLLAAATVKWVLVYLLFHSVLTKRTGYTLLVVTVLMELIIGLMGYFSGFKSVFFVLIIVTLAHRKLDQRRLALMTLVAVALLALGIVWTAIKGDYREFLNQGSGQQEVVVPRMERLSKLVELTSNLNRTTLEDGLDNLILRVSYVNFFSLTMANVPANIPYEQGRLWLGAFEHVLMPRFLFPNKAAIDDSARTAYYSGVEMAGREQGTSISIGYFGESYIDFGPVGMFVPIFLMGLLDGAIYRYFAYHTKWQVLGFGMATAILVFGAFNIETSNIKVLGGILTDFTVMFLLMIFLRNNLREALSTPAPSQRSKVTRNRPNERGAKPLRSPQP